MPSTRAHASLDALQRHIGQRIQVARLASGLTQEVAADLAGIDVKRWQRLEAGQVNATVKTLWRVAEATGVDVSALIVLGPAEAELGDPALAEPASPNKVEQDAASTPAPGSAGPLNEEA